MQHFLTNRLAMFCEFQDMIMKDNHYLFHSCLSPYLNIGLLTPSDLLTALYNIYAQKNLLNSIEALVRQLCWREYMMMLSTTRATEMKQCNFFNSTRKIGPTWYNGTTGIIILDNTIKQVVKTGYTHHIERLMILGSWMLMKGAEPRSAYKWFMEMFIDAYEWVMIPNVYGMAMWSCGPLVTGRPYLGSSNYFDRMSDYSDEAKKQWNSGYETFFREKGSIIGSTNIYAITHWYQSWLKRQAL
jgi:deoxyribodipyrimidine photolyase-related protein